MKRLILLLLLLPTLAFAGIDCTDENIATAFSALEDGGTITCNSGTFTFDGDVTFSGKSVKLVGNNTTLTMTQQLSLDSSGSKTIEVSGFTFDIQTGEGSYGIITIGDMTGTIYIHANQFYTTNYYAIYNYMESGVVISNNTFGSNGTRSANEPLYFTSHSAGTVSQQNSLKRAVGFGQNHSSTIDWPTIENNTFWMVAGTNPAGSTIMDAKEAAKIRIRYNTIHDGYIYVHGICESCPATDWGTYAMEVYNNHFIMHDGVQHYAWLYLHLSTARIHNNRLDLYGANAHFDSYLTWELNREDPTKTNQSCEQGKQYLDDKIDVGFCTSSGVGTNSWYACYGASDWCSSAPCGNGNKGSCGKKLCSNAWTLCAVDGDCSGGTCSRYLDDSYFDSSLGMPAGAYGSGQWIDAATAYVASEPIYVWSNARYNCDADGSNCVIDDDNTDMNSVTGLASDYGAVNTNFFSSAPSPNTLSTCPISLVDPTGLYSCDESSVGAQGATPNNTGYWKLKSGGGMSLGSGASMSIGSGAVLTLQ